MHEIRSSTVSFIILHKLFHPCISPFPFDFIFTFTFVILQLRTSPLLHKNSSLIFFCKLDILYSYMKHGFFNKYYVLITVTVSVFGKVSRLDIALTWTSVFLGKANNYNYAHIYTMRIIFISIFIDFFDGDSNREGLFKIALAIAPFSVIT